MGPARQPHDSTDGRNWAENEATVLGTNFSVPPGRPLSEGVMVAIGRPMAAKSFCTRGSASSATHRH